MLGKEEFCNLSWTRYFELRHPLMLFQKSANSVFQKEVEMWERIHYLANDSKIQKTITEQVPRIYKGFSFLSLFSRLQIPDRKATESPISPTVLIVDKFWRKKIPVLNLCFSHLMRWEILVRPTKRFWCTGIWSLWNVLLLLWQL